ncbi:MAG: glycosyltransferase [Treponema sp.]|nr:glycosyltransferase [Treponema sp.]
MNLLDILCYSHAVIHIILHIALMIGIVLECKRDKKTFKADGAKVSVIIPIHNESQRMQGLMRTLINQTYKAQIIFIDDRSSDESPAILARFAKDAKERGIDCKIITLSENPGPNFKQFALSRGIIESDGDYFLFTDGDCEVPPEWISVMVSRIQNAKTGAALGPVFKKKENDKFFSLFQSYDHILRYNYLTGSTGLGAAGGGFGNNLIVSKKALTAIGGYDAIPPSPTEDASLISRIRSASSSGVKFQIRTITSHGAAVETIAEKKWPSFLNQSLRWHNGGLFSPEIFTRLNYNLLALIISTGILAVLFLPFFPWLWPLPAGVLINMIINTIAAFSLYKKEFPRDDFKRQLNYILCLLFMPVYFTLMTIMSYAKIKTTWKNAELKIKKS